ncbi:actin-like ATPase domain-containing protein [Aaosphaeria arxii CBS 175.79]|uniref:Phosphotransferase n=1 Tax=Aaosphaeria arxii CBS 175.79 TaxID=1450172 RepID=A0A6A5X6Z6_9PLEO|nr:actin-like ATPase domain-containing protein [Aaosphaeria arxii CBS 175.79]KAF2008554.1 actin-like ATPase domain-containing protein [Aaosphaeria arxii CBS 175.79]
MLSHDSEIKGPASPLVRGILDQFDLTDKHVRNITRKFVQQMRDGLIYSRPWQLPSYVCHIPDGTEKGTFLTVDLGGTNCRICLVNLLGDSTYKVVQTKKTVPAHVRINPRYKPLFDFISEAIGVFLDRPDLRLLAEGASRIPLSFTFSFTCEQTSISQGTLIQWDKGWNIPEAIGENPCAMLQQSVDELKLPVHVVALANDSVGTMLTRAYTAQSHGSTLAGVIIGTGTNAAYIEKLSNVKRISRAGTTVSNASMVINTEWGCFDDDLETLPTTSFDRSLDINSNNPGSQQLEKRVSGMYLGELLRLVIVACYSQGIFDMALNSDSSCNCPYGLDSSFLSLLASSEQTDTPEVTAAIEEVLLAKNVTSSDVRTLQQLANGIAKRSARLAGSGLGAIILQSGRLRQSRHEKELIEVTSVQARKHATQSLKSSGRGCRLLCWISQFFAQLGFSARQPKHAPETTVQDRNEDDIVDVGVDGSLIEKYPGFENFMRSALRDIDDIGWDGERRIQMGFARDGSAVGAALMAKASVLA